MTILEMREKIVKAQELLKQINKDLMDLYLEQEGYIDCGNGCKIPNLETNAKINARIPPPCCGG